MGSATNLCSGRFAAEMVEREVGGNPSRPSCEVSIRPKLFPRPIGAPKGLNGQILRNAWITHDAHNPGVNVALELPNQDLESIDLAKRKSLEKIHEHLYCLLRVRNDSVTSFFMFARTRGETAKSRSAGQTGKCLSMGCGTLSTYVPHSEWMTRDLTDQSRLSGTEPLSAHLD